MTDAESSAGADGHDQETCVEEERWLDDDAPDSEIVVDGESVSGSHEFPDCGRTYDYVFVLHGLWSVEDDEYIWFR